MLLLFLFLCFGFTASALSPADSESNIISESLPSETFVPLHTLTASDVSQLLNAWELGLLQPFFQQTTGDMLSMMREQDIEELNQNSDATATAMTSLNVRLGFRSLWAKVERAQQEGVPSKYLTQQEVNAEDEEVKEEILRGGFDSNNQHDHSRQLNSGPADVEVDADGLVNWDTVGTLAGWTGVAIKVNHSAICFGRQEDGAPTLFRATDDLLGESERREYDELL